MCSSEWHLIGMANRSSVRAVGAEGSQCQGWLFKLKENNKEWKKIYVVLKDCDIIYYDSPHSARADKRSKDGTKSVLSASEYNDFNGVRPPTSTPGVVPMYLTFLPNSYRAEFGRKVRSMGTTLSAPGR